MKGPFRTPDVLKGPFMTWSATFFAFIATPSLKLKMTLGSMTWWASGGAG
jgi:hypothetical protein